MKKRAAGRARKPVWHLALYVTSNASSRKAVENTVLLCKELPEGRCKLEIYDIENAPQIAQAQNIVAVPTLDRLSPPPMKRIVGCGSLDDFRKALEIGQD